MKSKFENALEENDNLKTLTILHHKQDDTFYKKFHLGLKVTLRSRIVIFFAPHFEITKLIYLT